MNSIIEQTEWQVRSNGQGFVVMDNNTNWIAEFKREDEAKRACELWNGQWLTPDDWSAVAEARESVITQLKQELCREQEKLKITDEKTVRENIAYLINATKEAVCACDRAWNAFENGKRKHHHDPLSGKCILGCQACAIEKLNSIRSKYKALV